ncbi:hypothetical protein FOXG_21051 [Fusarium oxysporum f. sp. lycopersici 4287]|uniref:Uncharacterized protein n=2 Tax=Fusarium oxysporum TaxID=5507 RepID=A0A0J9VSM2_FUSO4|nr:hypothetical protein FOXG_21010 [Fusarium oxysporum f. sp. lycopersici 4287]XP_018252161.1 hypothetical protein FOXG_21051 [Fusarium oxysporum f. sp. lycopersici 4287]EWZ77859.1 hypothetical protein FOWG_17768 [Fusarium oxysporum f. sp. lycopersici MN25]EXM14142.1 hypothetical protein FOTG_17442 [Fusarium oxysporum f. sp. vasinfectum 25433]KAJ9412602.1 hypothetical protein QL093DRAFT_2545079 [Fusarium oxysporum]KNB13999.1 hypothetical protein FOXG_21010 [Fusarium oxysporum f. sp. lycopersic
MSGKLPSLVPGQASHQRDQPSRQQAAAFRKLIEKIPKSENEWQDAREVHRFATPEDVYRTVLSLVQDIQGEYMPEDLRRLIYIAVCCVDHSENEAEAYHKYRSRVHAKDDLREFTIRNYMSLVRGLVTLLDGLYLKLRHRGFEAALLFAPLNLGALGYYKQAPDQFASCFPTIEITPEVQSSLALYLPFIITTRHPEYRYKKVCRALGTNIFNEEEYLKFVSVLQSGRPIPYVLPAPNTPDPSVASPDNKGRYDPVRDQWLPVTIPNLTGYKPFTIPESIQQIIARAGKQQDDPVSQDILGAVIFRFRWSRDHQEAVDRVIDVLKHSGFLSTGASIGMQFFYRHDSGSIVVPMGYQAIIIPAVATTEAVTVTISHQDTAEDIIWNVISGLLLGQGTKLTTRRSIHYNAVMLPILKP